MKILQINNYPFRKGGAEAVFHNIISLLKSKGHKVISFSREISGYASDNIEYLIPEEKFFLSRFYSINAQKLIKEILIKEKPDIVHIHNLVGGISFSILPIIKKFNIPIVASIHDLRLLCPVGIMVNGKGEICEKCKVRKYFNGVINKCHPYGLFNSSVVVLESYLRDFFLSHKKYFDAYLFVSEFTKNKFLEYHPEISKKSNVVYNFTNLFDTEIIRGKYFLYFGRYDREKGINTLLNAFKNIKDYNLLLAGRGPLEDKIKEYENNYPNIKNVGFKSGDDLTNLIKNSEAVIIPSECYENLPMSAVESLSLSKPIITTALGGLKELTENSNAGFLFNYGNHDSLVKFLKLFKIMTDEEYTKLSANAYNFAIKNFNSELFYTKLISIYQELAKQNE